MPPRAPRTSLVRAAHRAAAREQTARLRARGARQSERDRSDRARAPEDEELPTRGDRDRHAGQGRALEGAIRYGIRTAASTITARWIGWPTIRTSTSCTLCDAERAPCRAHDQSGEVGKACAVRSRWRCRPKGQAMVGACRAAGRQLAVGYRCGSEPHNTRSSLAWPASGWERCGSSRRGLDSPSGIPQWRQPRARRGESTHGRGDLPLFRRQR